MNEALYWLLGVEPEDWAEGGTWSLQWLGAPRGGDTTRDRDRGRAMSFALAIARRKSVAERARVTRLGVGGPGA